MINEIIKYSKNIDGNIFTLGFSTESKLVKSLENNKKINSIISFTNKGKSKKRKIFSGKTVKVTKLKKYFKKENIDYSFIEYSSINKFLKNIIKDTINITNKKIYFYIDIKVNDIDEIIYRFERYGCTVESIGKNDIYLLKIDTKNIKTTFIQNIKYNIKDISYDIAEAIAFVLIGG